MVDIQDGDAFSITLADEAHPCIIYPSSLYARRWCPRDAKPLAEAPKVNPDSRMLALGSVRADAHGVSAMATLVATATRFAENSEPVNLDEFARGMADGLVKSRPGSKLRAPPHAQLVTLGGVHSARITFDVDGLSTQGLDHVVSYAAWSEGGDYNVTFMGPPAAADAVDALADRAAATLHVARPAPVREKRLERSVAPTVLGMAGALFVPALVWSIVRRKKPRPST